MERFELLPHLTFFEERQQLAFIGNVPPCPYVRLCKQLRDGATLSPLFGITAVLGSSAIVDRFLQQYLTADENGKDEQAPKVAFGMAAIILKCGFDEVLQEWLLMPDEERSIFERYFADHLIEGRTLTTEKLFKLGATEQLAKLGAKHIAAEQTYLDETRKQWEKHLPDHPKPLEIATSAAERYIEFVKDKTKSNDHPAIQESVEDEQHGDNESQSSSKQTGQTIVKQGRAQPFAKLMIDDADGTKLSILHEVMNGKIGKQAAIIIEAAIEALWLLRPTFTQVQREFGYIGAKSGYNNYIKDKNLRNDVERMKNALIQALAEHK